MSNWVIWAAVNKAGQVFDIMRSMLLEQPVIHADETVVQVLHEPGKRLRRIQGCRYTVQINQRINILRFLNIRLQETAAMQLIFWEIIRDTLSVTDMTDTTN